MRARFLAVLAAGVLVSQAVAQSDAAAQEAETVGKSAGDMMLRFRVIGVIPETDGTISPAINGHPDISSEPWPELDFSYFLTRNLALEVIAASPQHDVHWRDSAAGSLDLGKVRLLPPTLTLQYHFFPDSDISPYVGAGINYTWFYDRSGPRSPAVTSVHYEDGVGAVLQIGVDYRLTGRWYVNFDVKQIFLNTTVTLNGGALATAKVDINPTIVAAGVGYRF